MKYKNRYSSPLGEMRLAADDLGLTGLWFLGQKHFAKNLTPDAEEKDLPVFESTKHWLNIYFSGGIPDFTPPLHLCGTPFQLRIWEMLCSVPYGTTVTYGALAKKLGKMSAQAVGGAVGRNPVSIIVPCHRVVGTDGNLTGYAGGTDKKKYLLALEKQI